jgi:hypothetical protein
MVYLYITQKIVLNKGQESFSINLFNVEWNEAAVNILKDTFKNWTLDSDEDDHPDNKTYDEGVVYYRGIETLRPQGLVSSNSRNF